MTHYSEAHQATKFADGMRCHYCAHVLTARTFSRDHIIPRNIGGEDEVYNIVPSCKRCNRNKASYWTNCTCNSCKIAVSRHAQLGVVKGDITTINPKFNVLIYPDGTCIRRASSGNYAVDPLTFKRPVDGLAPAIVRVK